MNPILFVSQFIVSLLHLLLPVSPTAQFQLQMKDEEGMDAVEQELTNVEVIERLEEAETLEDELEEKDALIRRLRKVRDLEERLQEVDEMAERLQEVIEEELGAEEVAKLRQEEEELEQMRVEQAAAITQTVVTQSLRRIKTNEEEEEVDELEEQIKKVFLKGLLPEEDEEADMKRAGEEEATDESLIDDSLSDKLPQIEKEWQDEGEKFGLQGVRTSSVVAYQKEERRPKKRVTIVDERGKQEEDIEVLVQSEVILETRMQKEKVRQKTKILERLETEDRSQVEEKDIRVLLLNPPPFAANVKPSGTVWRYATLCFISYTLNI